MIIATCVRHGGLSVEVIRAAYAVLACIRSKASPREGSRLFLRGGRNARFTINRTTDSPLYFRCVIGLVSPMRCCLPVQNLGCGHLHRHRQRGQSCRRSMYGNIPNPSARLHRTAVPYHRTVRTQPRGTPSRVAYVNQIQGHFPARTAGGRTSSDLVARHPLHI